jgi:hypothetical protein
MIHRRHRRSPEWAEIKPHARDLSARSILSRGEAQKIEAIISSSVSFVVDSNIIRVNSGAVGIHVLSNVDRMPTLQNLRIGVIPMKLFCG